MNESTMMWASAVQSKIYRCTCSSLKLVAALPSIFRASLIVMDANCEMPTTEATPSGWNWQNCGRQGLAGVNRRDWGTRKVQIEKDYLGMGWLIIAPLYEPLPSVIPGSWSAA